ncbi:hypothetical protein ADIS_1472 [Lunatimonas lonarensis]|uniref:DUF349 domain-containing protein n=1 Tax=Lunatimonas lonarensis TaxID=1232681 RepID=R7ZV73_9BACT|nr:DUF349 domain-containing protein [Lunatimonas lonarensis]EON77933.1 hypothetical protein ADIS_1472 [Lunatimonas lonarensis]
MENDKEMSQEDNKVTQQVNEQVEAGSKVGAHEVNAESEEEQVEENHEEEAIDYSGYSKLKLLQALKDILNENEYIKKDALVNDIKSHFDEIYHKEKDSALEQFLSNGGEADDFAYRDADEDKLFFVAYHEFKSRRSKQIKENERVKEQNALAKNAVLDKLRELVDSEETTSSINAIKAIQQEWKSIGPVPANQNKNLWASYNALMDRFYDNQSIYFELKELDRKKNLENKSEICERAEGLAAIDDLKEAIKVLNELHEEFKHIGPVPREEQERVWQRFKAASDAVYARRKDYYEAQKSVFKGNLDLKLKLIEKLQPFKDFQADRIKEWNLKTKEMLSIQKDWEAIGPVPKENGKDVNKAFWGLFKQFFSHKNQFFKELDDIRKKNKEKAEQLIAEAEKFQESTDWKHAADELIRLQKEWKGLGPMPEKIRDELYNRFKTACDTFFQSRRNSNKEANKEYEDNLAKKAELCRRIVEEAKTGSGLSEEQLEHYIHEFNAIGFVPRKNMKEISASFSDAVDAYIGRLGVEGADKEEFLFRLNLNKIQADPNSARVLNKKEHGIRKQITDLENSITLWKNNLEFFAASKTADKLKDQFEVKIDKAEQEVDRLKKKLSIIREF